jgi:hypothetical protein
VPAADINTMHSEKKMMKNMIDKMICNCSLARYNLQSASKGVYK